MDAEMVAALKEKSGGEPAQGGVRVAWAPTGDADTLYLTFDTPPGDTFTVSCDAYIRPASQQGRDATVAVLDHGVAVASVHIHTHLLP